MKARSHWSSFGNEFFINECIGPIMFHKGAFILLGLEKPAVCVRVCGERERERERERYDNVLYTTRYFMFVCIYIYIWMCVLMYNYMHVSLSVSLFDCVSRPPPPPPPPPHLSLSLSLSLSLAECVCLSVFPHYLPLSLFIVFFVCSLSHTRTSRAYTTVVYAIYAINRYNILSTAFCR